MIRFNVYNTNLTNFILELFLIFLMDENLFEMGIYLFIFVFLGSPYISIFFLLSIFTASCLSPSLSLSLAISLIRN